GGPIRHKAPDAKLRRIPGRDGCGDRPRVRRPGKQNEHPKGKTNERHVGLSRWVNSGSTWYFAHDLRAVQTLGTFQRTCFSDSTRFGAEERVCCANETTSPRAAIPKCPVRTSTGSRVRGPANVTATRQHGNS